MSLVDIHLSLKMANFTELNTVITDLFGVIATLISEVVTLMTGDLLVLAVVGAVVGLILAVIYGLMTFIRNHVSSSTKMRK